MLNIITFVLAFFVIFFPENAIAQTGLNDSSGSFTGLLDLVQQTAGNWDAKLRTYAEKLFVSLATIQFIWTFFPLVFKQAELPEIVGELIRFIIVIGFFLALLMFSTEWGAAIIDSFREAGGVASGYGKQIKPGDVFGTGVELYVKATTVDVGFNILAGFTIGLAGVLILLSFIFISAFMGLTLIESYIVINASVFFMGFGASQWTREYALAIVRYAVSVGAKLFILTLLVGLILDSAKTWQAAYVNNQASMFTMVGLSLTCAYFAKTIPELVAGLISGTSSGGGSTIGGMAAAMAAGAAAIATAGAGALAGAAASATGSGANSGLAGLINSSMAGGGSAGTAASAGSGAASGSAIGGTSSAAGGVSGSASGVAKTAGATPRIGGGGGESASNAPKEPGKSSSNSQQASSGIQQVAQQANKISKAAGKDEEQGQAPTQKAPQTDQSKQQSNEAPAATEQPQTINMASMASVGVRGSGIMAAIAVPGMESAAGLSLDTPPPGADMNGGKQDGSEDGDMAPDNVNNGNQSNVIRPAEASTPQPAAQVARSQDEAKHEP